MSEETAANVVEMCMKRLQLVLEQHKTIPPSPVPSIDCHSEENFKQARNAAKYLPIIKQELELALGLYERVFKILAKG